MKTYQKPLINPDKLRDFRATRALSQRDLAARAGVTQFTISRIERSEGISVRPKTVRALCDALGCEPQDLYLAEDAE